MSDTKKRVICFDLEGPLSPQDNAYEVMGLLEGGYEIFEVLSKYDDFLALEKRSGYEAGDTLSLIVPFLLEGGLMDDDIIAVSSRAKIINGVPQTISNLKNSGWSPYIISTSYSQHAYSIGSQIGINPEQIFCTKLALSSLRDKLGPSEIALIKSLKEDISSTLYPKIEDEALLKERLDRFYYKDIRGTGIERCMREVIVVGGQRKLDAAREIAKNNHLDLSRIVCVGDSITDYKMLAEIKNSGGLAIAFNGNSYSIPHANVSLATTDMRFIQVLLSSWDAGGLHGVEQTVSLWEKTYPEYIRSPRSACPKNTPEALCALLRDSPNPEDTYPRFNYIKDPDELEQIIAIHSGFRSKVRGSAAKLG